MDQLPGFEGDRLTQALPALARNCNVKPPVKALPTAWEPVCAELTAKQNALSQDNAALRLWLSQRFLAYRVEGHDGQGEGLATGYFEPMYDASRTPTPTMRHAVHRAPSDIGTRRPWATRAQADNDASVREQLRGREIAYLADALDVLMVQIQGSGRLRISEPDGRTSTVRLAFAAHNDQPYQSVGRWLISQGEIKADDAGWGGIRAWAKRNPDRVREMLHANPRLVFFKEEPIHNAAEGPRGAQGVPLTAERSIAVDPRSIPYGTPVWVDTTDPMTAAPLRRLMMAQDTGGAIVGAVRADYFWGLGERAEQQASRMRHRLKMWALVPKGPAP
jgi:membrane-bound lytic murein transglycosylase A